MSAKASRNGSGMNLPKLKNANMTREVGASISPRGVSSSPQHSPVRKVGSNLSYMESGRKRNGEYSSRTSEIRMHAKGEASALSKSQAIPKGMFKVSIQDMINSSKKVNDNWGLEGYTMK